jgi:hypothetical protein
VPSIICPSKVNVQQSITWTDKQPLPSCRVYLTLAKALTLSIQSIMLRNTLPAPVQRLVRHPTAWLGPRRCDARDIADQ